MYINNSKQNNSKQYLSTAMQNSLNEEIVEVLSEVAEVGLDTIMNEGFLQEIPIMSLTMSMFRIGNSIRERYYLKKLASFVLAMNKGMADNDRREFYKSKIINDPKTRSQELEYILILIDRYLHADKTCMLSKVYLSYLEGIIDWNDFTKYSEVIDRFLPGDCETLVSANTYKTERDINTDSIQRLIALGLVIEGYRRMAVKDDGGTIHFEPPELLEKNERNYSRTEFGDILARILSENI